MTYLEEIATLRERATALLPEFLDANGNGIRIGDFVHYVREREGWEGSSVWNTDRWGQVVGLIKTAEWDGDTNKPSTTKFAYSVQVRQPNVITDRKHAWFRDEWTAEPTSLEIVE